MRVVVAIVALWQVACWGKIPGEARAETQPGKVGSPQVVRVTPGTGAPVGAGGDGGLAALQQLTATLKRLERDTGTLRRSFTEVADDLTGLSQHVQTLSTSMETLNTANLHQGEALLEHQQAVSTMARQMGRVQAQVEQMRTWFSALVMVLVAATLAAVALVWSLSQRPLSRAAARDDDEAGAHPGRSTRAPGDEFPTESRPDTASLAAALADGAPEPEGNPATDHQLRTMALFCSDLQQRARQAEYDHQQLLARYESLRIQNEALLRDNRRLAQGLYQMKNGAGDSGELRLGD